MAKKDPGSIFQEGEYHRGVFQLKDEFGVPFKKTFRSKDPKKLKKRMALWLQDFEDGKPTEDMKVKKMCDLAIGAAEHRGAAPKTLKGYRDLLRAHIEPTMGAMMVKEVKPAHVERMMALMAEKGAGSQTRVLARNFLRMAINRVAIKGGYVVTNAAALADPPKIKHVLRTSLQPAQLAAILEKEDRPMFHAMWVLLASTGLRPSEARNLLWNDFYQSKDGPWLKLHHSKTQEGMRPIPIPFPTWEVVSALPKTALYVFATANGHPINESNLRREWVAAMKKAGVPFTNLYQLRKLFGTLKARKVSDDILKRLMRHTDVRTTKQFYVSALEADLRAAVED